MVCCAGIEESSSSASAKNVFPVLSTKHKIVLQRAKRRRILNARRRLDDEIIHHSDEGVVRILYNAEIAILRRYYNIIIPFRFQRGKISGNRRPFFFFCNRYRASRYSFFVV